MHIASIARHGRGGAVAALGAIAICMALTAQPLLAATLLHDTGVHGTYAVTDSNGSPGGRCGYGAADSHGTASLVWVKVKLPAVYARDTSGSRDHQAIEWRIQVQRSTSTAGPWATGGTSSWEKALAYDDTPAVLHAKTFRYTTSANQYVRALMQIRWLRSGSVEGSVTLSIDWYSVHWTVGAPDFVFSGSCTSRAD